MAKTDSLPALSEGQLEILNVVWKRGEVTVGDVWTELSQRRPIARNTIQTTIVRLEDKGWLRHRADGNTFYYWATQPAHTVRRKMTRRLVDTLFHGSTEGLLLALLEKESLAPDEAERNPGPHRPGDEEAAMMFLGSIDAIETAAGWMALAAVPIAVAAVAGLALASFVRRDPASRHAILTLALVAVCGSPCGVWFAHRAGWSLFILPWLISPPPPVAPLAVSIDGRDHLANANSIDRLAPRDVAEIAPGSVASPIEDVRSTHLRETTGGRILADKAVGPPASHPADGHRLSAFVPLAAVIGLATWAAGLIFFLARMVHGWLAARRICRDATPLERDRFAGLIERVEQRFGLRRPLRIVVSDEIGTAAAVGGLHPQIILPANYVAQLSMEELEPVLIHETAHLVRQDDWIALLQRLAAAVYWPHPLVHLLNRRLARAREECCDNYVLQQVEPRRYAQLLLRLAEWPVSWRRPAPTLGFLTRRWKLEERIADLLDARRQSTVHPRRTFVVVAGTAIGAFALASAGLRLTQASDRPATASATLPQTASAQAAAQITEKSPSHPAASADTRPSPQMDLPGHASVQLGNLRFRTEASDLAFLPDGKTIVSASWRDGIKYWDIATGSVRLHVPAKAEKMRMTADRKRLVTQDTYDREHTSLQIWNAADGNQIASVKWPLPKPCHCRGPAGPHARRNRGNPLRCRTARSAFAIWRPGGCSKSTRSRRAPSGRSRSRRTAHSWRFPLSNELFLWEWQSEKPPVVVGAHRRYLSLAFSPDGKHLAAGGDTKQDVRIFNVETHALERSLRDPNAKFLRVDDLAFTQDGNNSRRQTHLRRSTALSQAFWSGAPRPAHSCTDLRFRVRIREGWRFPGDGNSSRLPWGGRCTFGISRPANRSAPKRRDIRRRSPRLLFRQRRADRHGKLRWHSPHLERRDRPRTASARSRWKECVGSGHFAGRGSRCHVGARRQSLHLADGDRKTRPCA